MRRLVWGGIVFALVIAAALLAFSFRRSAPRATALVPDTTLLFVDVPNVDRLRTGFRQTDVYALLQEPTLAGMFATPRRMLLELLGGPTRPERDERFLNLVQQLFRGETFLAVTHVSALPTLDVGVVFGIDVQRKELEARAALSYLQRRLRRRNPDALSESKNYLGVSYSVNQLRPDLVICNAALGSMLVFTLGEDTMRDVITRFTRQAPADSPALIGSENYRLVTRHLPRNTAFAAYLNVEQVMRLLSPLLALSPKTAGMLDKFTRIKATGTSMSFVDGKVRDVGYTAFAKPVTNTMVIKRNTLAFAPAETTLYAAQSIDLAGAYRQIMDAAAQFGNVNVTAAATRIHDALTRRGVRMESVLARLGPEVAIIGNWREGARVPDCAFVSEFTGDTAARAEFDSAMTALKEALLGSDEDFPWVESEHAGHKLRTTHIGADVIAPTYTFVDHFLVVALTPGYARELLTQAHEARAGLTTNATYVDAMRRLPANGAEYFYCDLPKLFSSVCASIPLPEDWPATETISKHLSPYASTRVIESGGETTITFSPAGKTALFLVAGIAGFAAAQDYVAPFVGLNPTQPRTSSDTDARPQPRENRTATSQIPPTE
jgi:hypothetical protein